MLGSFEFCSAKCKCKNLNNARGGWWWMLIRSDAWCKCGNLKKMKMKKNDTSINQMKNTGSKFSFWKNSLTIFTLLRPTIIDYYHHTYSNNSIRRDSSFGSWKLTTTTIDSPITNEKILPFFSAEIVCLFLNIYHFVSFFFT